MYPPHNTCPRFHARGLAWEVWRHLLASASSPCPRGTSRRAGQDGGRDGG
eukprot:gene3934-14437_t